MTRKNPFDYTEEALDAHMESRPEKPAGHGRARIAALALVLLGAITAIVPLAS